MYVYNINNECLTHSSQFISVKVKKNLRKSRLKQNYGFLIKNVYVSNRDASLHSLIFVWEIVTKLWCVRGWKL